MILSGHSMRHNPRVNAEQQPLIPLTPERLSGFLASILASAGVFLPRHHARPQPPGKLLEEPHFIFAAEIADEAGELGQR
jgi:hypothetical protein